MHAVRNALRVALQVAPALGGLLHKPCPIAPAGAEPVVREELDPASDPAVFPIVRPRKEATSGLSAAKQLDDLRPLPRKLLQTGSVLGRYL